MTSQSPDPMVLMAVTPVLRAAAQRGICINYRDLAVEAGVEAPHSIHRTTMALEAMIRDDHAAGRPLLAALAISKRGIPAPGFFQLLRDLGRYDGPDTGAAAERHHAHELEAALAYWGRADTADANGETSEGSASA